MNEEMLTALREAQRLRCLGKFDESLSILKSASTAVALSAQGKRAIASERFHVFWSSGNHQRAEDIVSKGMLRASEKTLKVGNSEEELLCHVGLKLKRAWIRMTTRGKMKYALSLRNEIMNLYLTPRTDSEGSAGTEWLVKYLAFQTSDCRCIWNGFARIFCTLQFCVICSQPRSRRLKNQTQSLVSESS